MTNLLVETTKKSSSCSKKVLFPRLKPGEKKTQIVRKMVNYLGKVRLLSKSSYTLTYSRDDVDQLLGEEMEYCLTYCSSVPWEDRASLISIFCKNTNTRSDLPADFIDNQVVIMSNHGTRGKDLSLNLFILVVDDALIKLKGYSELKRWYYFVDGEQHFYSIVSYSFLELLSNATTDRDWREYSSLYTTVADYILDTYDDALAHSLNKEHSNNAFKSIATITDDKIFQDSDMNKSTIFNDLGFRKCEIDTERYQGKEFNRFAFRSLEHQWKHLCNKLPHSSVRPELKIRKLGKHKATGLFVPNLNILAIDVRVSNSFIHEYGHYLDHTYHEHEDISLNSNLFKTIREQYRKNLGSLVLKAKKSNHLSLREQGETIAKKWDYYITPTEIFARAFELWVHFCIDSGTELTKSTKDYQNKLEYVAFRSFQAEVFSFFYSCFDGFEKNQPIFSIQKRIPARIQSNKPTTGEQLSLFE